MSTNDLARDIFGGSESELSSDEEDNRQQRQRAQKKPRQRSERPAEESSEGDSEEDYRDEDGRGTSAQPKRAKAGRKRGPPEGKAQRKRKRKEPTEIDLSELPPEQASKMRLDMQIEAILKPKKASRARKKKANEEVLDSFADAEVARLREAMNAAADEDYRANAEKLPAVAKLRLLPEAMLTLQKAAPALAQSMVDNNLLEAVKRWLEPLPDRSLPALNIQRELFATLRKMEFIDSSVLKESGLGPVVLFYTKCKRVTPEIARIANELISTWSRPIIKRSASYRDRVIPTLASGEDGAHRNVERLNAILARAKEAEKGRVKRNAVMIPQRELGTYTVAPRANAGLALSGRAVHSSVDEDVERRRKNADRLRMLKSKVGSMK